MTRTPPCRRPAPASRHAARRRGDRPPVPAGFTLMEVLVTIGIFLIGMVAVAAIFPVATYMQKQSIGQVMSQQVAQNAEAMLKARRFREAELAGLGGYEVQPLPAAVLERWTLYDRSYPGTVPDPVERDFHWVPLIRYKPDGSWQVVVFVLGNDFDAYDTSGIAAGVMANPPLPPGDVRLPRVVSTSITGFTATEFLFDNHYYDAVPPADEADQVRPGEMILDSNGNIYSVVAGGGGGVTVDGLIIDDPAPPNRIWYGRPAGVGDASPTRRLIILEDVVSP